LFRLPVYLSIHSRYFDLSTLRSRFELKGKTSLIISIVIILTFSHIHTTMMFSSTTCRFLVFLSLSLSTTAETVRGAQRELQTKEPTVELLTAGDYVILSKTGITNVPDSVITGSIATSPIAAGAITGFSLIADSGGKFSKSPQVTGSVTAASYGGDTPTLLTTAVSAMETAYTDAAGRVNADAARKDIGGGTLGGAYGGATNPLTPGVYTFGTTVNIADTIYFEGTGVSAGQGDTDVFIIQIEGQLLQAGNIRVELTNGALAKNIFWQVSEAVTVGAGAHMEGILLGKTAATFITGSSMNGRILLQTACNLQKATITQTA
jgi:hypothetical protein